MKTQSPPFPTHEEPHLVDVMIAYDEVHAAKHAKATCDRVGRWFGPPLQLHLHIWKMDAFRSPDACRAAARAARKAAVIVFAIDGARVLPPEVCAWLEQPAGAEPPGLRALVAVLHSIPRSGMETSPAWIALRNCAEKTGMDFICETIDRPEEHATALAGTQATPGLDSRAWAGADSGGAAL